MTPEESSEIQALRTVRDPALLPELRRIFRNAARVETLPGQSVSLWANDLPHPVLVVSRNPGGTLTFTDHPGRTGPHTNLIGSIKPPTKIPNSPVLLHNPLEPPDPTVMAYQEPRMSTMDLGARSAIRQAAALVQQHLDCPPPDHRLLVLGLWSIYTKLDPGDQRGTDDDALTQELQQAVRQLIDHRAWQLAARCHPTVHIERYNSVVTNLDHLQDLASSNPGAVGWLVAFQPLFPDPVEHPGQLIALARQSLQQAGLAPQHWRFAARSPIQTFHDLTHPAGAASPPLAAQLLNIMASADAHPATGILHMTLRANQVQQIHIQHTIHDQQVPVHTPVIQPTASQANHRKLLQLLFRESKRRLQQDPGDPQQEALIEEFTQASDYNNHLCLEDIPLRNTTWQGLNRASEQWHRHLQQEQIRRRWLHITTLNQNRCREWNSLLETQELEGCSAVPLTSERQLYEESITMRNCVVQYGFKCAAGDTRIFSVRRGTQHIATGEIQLHDQRWTVVQTRGPANHPADPEAITIMKLTALSYQQAWQEAGPQPHHNWHSNQPTEPGATDI